MNKIQKLIAAAICAAGLVFPAFSADFHPLQVIPQGGNEPITFNVELATTPEESALGLMFRTALPEGEGMIFIQENERVASMWMKNTKIPLDMLFVDSAKRIVHIHRNAEPESLAIISSQVPVLYVVELAGGVVDKHGISLGDSILFSTEKVANK